MKLLVDVGNSRLKWAFATPDGLTAPGEAELASLPESLPGALLDAGYAPDEIRVANVAGAALGERIVGQLARRFGLQPVVATSAHVGAGVTNGYYQPQQLGVDRWLAMCAAFSRHRSAVWVADAGTATTLDRVTADGRHRGGLILPGMILMESVLFRRTGDLARLAGRDSGTQTSAPGEAEGEISAGPLGLGCDTATAIRMGALQATASVIVRYLSASEDPAVSGHGAVRLVLTGGLGVRLRTMLDRQAGPGRKWEIDHRPALVLEGLALDPPCFIAIRRESA